jgi:hypothetical protein
MTPQATIHTARQESPTRTHQQYHHAPPDLPDGVIPPQYADCDPATERLAAYVRRVVDTAPSENASANCYEIPAALTPTARNCTRGPYTATLSRPPRTYGYI